MSKYSTIVGLDVGDKYSHFCMMDREGITVEEGRVATKKKVLERKFARMERARIALEVGTHSPWVSRLLKQCGHEVLVANAAKVALIYGSKRKRDALDARTLARLARFDPKLLYPIEHRGAQAQADLAVMRARDALVKARTQLINHVRGSLKAMGYRAEKCSTDCFHKRVGAQIPQELSDALAPLVAFIGELTERIAQYDKQLDEIAARRYPETALLRQVKGVGPVTSLAYVLTLEEPHRFSKSRSVGAYLGLVPREDQSSDSSPQLRITKAGDRMVRKLLIGAAHYIMGPFGPDTDLRRWGLAIAERGGKNAKKRAAVAVARRLAVLLHRLWVTGQIYEPLGYSGGAALVCAAVSDERCEGSFSTATQASSA